MCHLYFTKKIKSLFVFYIKQHILQLLTTTQEKPIEKNRYQIAFSIFILLAAGIKLYYHMQQYMDIQFADEAAYIQFGLALFEKMNRNWGPLYAVWYKCLSYFTTSPILLYYINFAITSIAMSLLMFIFLIRLHLTPIVALFISFCILVSDLNVSVWPRVSHFCLMICLISLIISSYIKPVYYKCIAFTIACLLCAYARPEFYLSFMIMLLVSLATLYVNKQFLSKNDFYILSFLLLIIGLLHLIFRFPSNDFFGYNRGVAAFYQHYAWNYKMRTGATFDAWLNWEDLAKKQFGDCNSILCVIKTQPGIFISNTLFNVRTYLLQLLKVCSFIFPIGLFYGKKKQLALTIIVLFTIVVLLFRKKSRVIFIEKIKAYRFYLLLLFCFITPTLMSCLAVFPRDHYLYLQMPFYTIILVCIAAYPFNKIKANKLSFTIFGVLLFLATPSIQSFSFMQFNGDKQTLCNKKLVNFLENKYSSKPHTIFTNLPFVHGMLPNNFKEINTIFDKKKHMPFTHYVDSAKIDMVIVLPSLLRDPHISSDSTWKNFITNYEQAGFKKEIFSDCDMYLLVKQAAKSQQ